MRAALKAFYHLSGPALRGGHPGSFFGIEIKGGITQVLHRRSSRCSEQRRRPPSLFW